MSQAICITIPIIPRAQMRARHTARKLKTGKIISTTYKHEKQEQAEQTLYPFLMEHQPKEPLTGALTLGVRCYMPIPASKPKWFTGTNKQFQEGARIGTVRPSSKPDLDNMIKQAKDCLNNMRFWKDDCQVVEFMIGTGKWYADNPRWEIAIQTL